MIKTIILILFAIMSNYGYSQSKDSIYTKTYYDVSKTKIHEEGYMVNKKRTGIWKEYTEDNWVRFEWTYKNNIKDGPYICFRKNGQVEATGFYKNGQLDGILKVYDENNVLVSESNWGRKRDGKTSELKGTTYYSKNIKPDMTYDTIDGKIYVWAFGEKFELPKDTVNKIIYKKNRH